MLFCSIVHPPQEQNQPHLRRVFSFSAEELLQKHPRTATETVHCRELIYSYSMMGLRATEFFMGTLTHSLV